MHSGPHPVAWHFPSSPFLMFPLLPSLAALHPQARQIRAPLSALVALYRECRYLPPKNPEKYLEPTKNPPTFAASKSNKRPLMRQNKNFRY